MKITFQTLHINRKVLAVACILIVLAVSAFWIFAASEEELPKELPIKPQPATQPQPEEIKLKFTSEPIPEEIRNKMRGVTISEKSPVDFDDLSYLTLTYIGYDGESYIGNMVVANEIADEVIQIFKELYNIKFPIEKMRLPYEYDGVDELSMRDNNTSAFNDRPIEGTGGLSFHQLGRAIDINPLVNPYIRFSDGEVLPTTAHKYLDRSLDEVGMIKEDSPCVEIFKKYGWTWGGDWTTVKDYQHFEKK